jgi:hypothetical protein
MGDVVVDLSMSLDGFIAGPNDGPGNPLGNGGGRLFDWMSAGTERIGPNGFVRPPARSRPIVEEWFNGGAIITGRRTFDIANGWSGHHPVGVPFFLLTHEPPGEHVGPGTEGTVVTRAAASRLLAPARPGRSRASARPRMARGARDGLPGLTSGQDRSDVFARAAPRRGDG